MQKYDHKKIEQKWRDAWEAAKVYRTTEDSNKEKFYILDMFPYPSGDGLHMGHTESYTASDILYRYKIMQGFDVLHPQGFDSFGLPAENYAIKTGVHPKKTTDANTKNYIKQMQMLGLAHDLDHLVYTSSPTYYRWTQWLFGKFFENGYVEQKVDTINWCSSCNTGLANEQVEGGRCERCKTDIQQKDIKGWFFKITDFAEALINDLDTVDWPESTKKNQRAWIGKSEGAEIEFAVSGADTRIKVFTTRPDTLFGATYLVLSPEHPLVEECKLKISNYDEVSAYVDEAKNKTEMERIEAKEKTGIKLNGVIAINPANKEDVPIYIADYVLGGYGTGAIMAVPAHDERDFEFAKKFGIEIMNVVSPYPNSPTVTHVGKIGEKFDTTTAIDEATKNILDGKDVWVKLGTVRNSGKFDGMDSEEAKKKITEFVGGKMTTNYRLRDWSMSRQRYWGCPIPIVYSPDGEAKFVGAENLPWSLPEDVDFVPTGEAPLSNSKELQARTEKLFGKGWTPEVDTMDTFVDSAWYFLRYPDTENEGEFCSKEMLKKWMPVDLYIGGAEHTYMHLLYARFFIKAMQKMGLVDFNEPFLKLRHQGMVLDKEGVKMSKSKGNVVNPNDMVERFGADAVRLNMMFAGPLEDDVMWDEDSVVGVRRFLERVWGLQELVADSTNEETNRLLHKTIKKVGEDIEALKYNTAISAMMIFARQAEKGLALSAEDLGHFLKILNPYAPFITEDMWSIIGNNDTLSAQQWPSYDETKLVEGTCTLALQVNGKVRAEVEVAVDISKEDVLELALANEAVDKWVKATGSGEVARFIYVTGRLANIVVQ